MWSPKGWENYAGPRAWTGTSRALGIARQTVEERHIKALEITNAVTVVPPYHSGGQTEIVRMPNVYAFDKGYLGFDRTVLDAFRNLYPKGKNFLVTPSAPEAYLKRFGDLEVTVCTPTAIGQSDKAATNCTNYHE